jgi:T3SS negative regulator,GrlR
MIEALWSVEFSSNVGFIGAGVVVIETGRVLGGDSGFMYVGNVRVEQSTVHIDVKVSRYSDVLTLPSIFGSLQTFHLKVSGPLNATNISFTGHVVENPALQIKVNAVRRAELP